MPPLDLAAARLRWCCCWRIVKCCPHCLCGFCVWSLLCYALLSVFSSFTIILARKRELIASWCLVAVGVLWRFHTVPRGRLQYVIVVSPDHTHSLILDDIDQNECMECS